MFGNRQSEPPKGFFKSLKKGLQRTRERFAGGLARLIQRRPGSDQDLIEEIETLMLSADMGVEATTRIVNNMKSYLSRKELSEPELFYQTLREEMVSVLKPVARPLVIPKNRTAPFVVLIVGVNGTGKTTTIGKLAWHLHATLGRRVLIGLALSRFQIGLALRCFLLGLQTLRLEIFGLLRSDFVLCPLRRSGFIGFALFLVRCVLGRGVLIRLALRFFLSLLLLQQRGRLFLGLALGLLLDRGRNFWRLGRC